jgi:hypothetical protein
VQLDTASLAADKEAMQKAYLDYVCHINQWLDRKSQLIGEQLLLHVKSLEVYHRSCAESCQQVLNKVAELSEASNSIIVRSDGKNKERLALATQVQCPLTLAQWLDHHLSLCSCSYLSLLTGGS